MTIRTWNSSGDTDCNDGANYSPTGALLSTDDLVFDNTSGVDCTLTAALDVASITFEQDYSGAFTNGAYDVDVGDVFLKSTSIGTLADYTFTFGSGTWTVAGDWDQMRVDQNADVSGNGWIVFTGTGKTFKAYYSNGNPIYPNIQIDDNASLTLDSYGYSITFNSIVVKTGATCTATTGYNGKDIAIGVTGNARIIDIQGTGELNLSASTVKLVWKGYHASSSFLSVASSATLKAQTVRFVCYKCLIKAGSVIDADVEIDAWAASEYVLETGNLEITGDFDFIGGAVAWNHGGALKQIDYSFGGDILNSGGNASHVWTKGTGTIELSLSSNQTAEFFGDPVEDIDIDKSAGTVTLSGNVETDSLTGTAGTLDIDGQTLTTVGNVVLAAGFSVEDTAGTGDFDIGGIIDINGTSGSHVTWTDADISALGSGANDAVYTDITDSNNSSGEAIDCTDCTFAGANTGSNLGWISSGGAAAYDETYGVSATASLALSDTWALDYAESYAVTAAGSLSLVDAWALEYAEAYQASAVADLALVNAWALDYGETFGVTAAADLALVDTWALGYSEAYAVTAAADLSLTDAYAVGNDYAESYAVTAIAALTLTGSYGVDYAETYATQANAELSLADVWALNYTEALAVGATADLALAHTYNTPGPGAFDETYSVSAQSDISINHTFTTPNALPVGIERLTAHKLGGFYAVKQ